MSVNKVILVGNVGSEPDIRTMQSGDEVVNLSVATSETWKDKTSGERKEKTEWHKVVVFNKGLVSLIKDHIHKGMKLYIEGQIETRSYEKDGQKRYITEIVLRFNGQISILTWGDKNETNSTSYREETGINTPVESLEPSPELEEDDIPF